MDNKLHFLQLVADNYCERTTMASMIGFDMCCKFEERCLGSWMFEWYRIVVLCDAMRSRIFKGEAPGPDPR